MLNEVPTARDPWALMQHLPGRPDRRPNVGGSESTNQAQFTARGDNGANTMWNIDGVTITDMAASGGSTTYFDFNVFEEVQFTTAGLDSRQQTGGLGINLVSKRGANALRALGPYLLQQRRAAGRERLERAEGGRVFRAIAFVSWPNTARDVSGPLCERIDSGSGPGFRELTSGKWRQRVSRRRHSVNTLAARGDAQPRRRHAVVVSLSSRRKAEEGPGRRRRTGRRKRRGTRTAPTVHLQGRGFARLRACAVSGKFAYVDLGFISPRRAVSRVRRIKTPRRASGTAASTTRRANASRPRPSSTATGSAPVTR